MYSPGKVIAYGRCKYTAARKCQNVPQDVLLFL